ncbi:hypothetical protein FNB79_14415 [Formosa sediminum]|uniref:Beta-lactamase-inhibitor-like PepSY-like domain-containing protein n=1 Tax=Formosa sediminum TaxID=2594004 RepID=A0A516GUE2_9FLAO|nr:hypothetical protein [Formosa sediminum]QDO95115.1 hypothetical protein FNB79_14415 [Formosa sediminum]
MKNLFLTSVFMGIILCSISFYAASPIKVVMEDGVFVLQDDFKEIEKDAVPDAITESVDNYFLNSDISKVYVNEAKEYKLEINQNGLNTIVYADTSGNWITK